MSLTLSSNSMPLLDFISFFIWRFIYLFEERWICPALHSCGCHKMFLFLSSGSFKYSPPFWGLEKGLKCGQALLVHVNADCAQQRINPHGSQNSTVIYFPLECDIPVEKVNLYKQPRQGVRTSTGGKGDLSVTLLQKLNPAGVRMIIIMRKNKKRSPQLSPALVECAFCSTLLKCCVFWSRREGGDKKVESWAQRRILISLQLPALISPETQRCLPTVMKSRENILKRLTFVLS